ncbi:MAG: hypothetical protein ACLQDI_18955, partial [Syntrophobacteraceae bacterium]
SYFTDKPDWIGYAGLLLLAAHKEHPQFHTPERASQHWDRDPAWQASTAEGFKSRFAQILIPEMWLPVNFTFTFKASDVTGNEAWFGSSVTLLGQLTVLNQETFKASESDLAQWRFDGAGREDPFEKSARLGLAMFMHHARLSVEHKLPMKLDY